MPRRDHDFRPPNPDAMTFLYDIGRVLLDFDFEGSLARLLPADCEDPHGRLGRLLERKDEFEAGRIDPEEYTTWALQVLGSAATREQFHSAWRHIFTPNDPMWACVRELSRRGHRLILFSNTNAIHVPWIYEAYPEFALFDEAVFSFEAGEIKPHPPIYQHALETHRLQPESTLYIDDLPQNIATGREFGFHCWEYRLDDHAAFERWLATFPL
jgi:putative hydrolase of the HAD superfamily